MHEGFMTADDPYDIFLMHYGTPHQGSTPHSGRWPYGSGENPFQRYKDLISLLSLMMMKYCFLTQCLLFWSMFRNIRILIVE